MTPPSSGTDPIALTLPGLDEPIHLRRSRRAKRLRLRVQATQPRVVLVIPAGVAKRDARQFLAQNQDWLATHLARLPAPRPFLAGTEVPILGVPHRITPTGETRGIVEQEDGRLFVPGAPAHLARRVGDYLRRAARHHALELIAAKAALAGLSPGSVTLRDTKSRWGSCSQSGAISLSWRLILAPPHVFDYVVAHETAHRRHHNHSAAFWRLCRELAADQDSAQTWLRRHGAGLHCYGQDP